MNPTTATDHRSKLYERYVTLQVGVDIAGLRRQFNAPQPALRRLVATHFPPERQARILDIGCGAGLLLHVLQQAGYHNVFGIETSPEQVATAHQLGMNCVHPGDLLDELRKNTDSFDAIVAFDVLEHFTKDEVLDVLQAAYGALRPGGRLLLHVPNGEAIFAGKIFFGDFTHQVAFTAKSLRQVAMYAGFNRVECFEDKPVVHGLFSAVRAGLWWLVRTKFRVINLIETGDPGTSLILSQNLFAVCRKSAVSEA